MAYSGPHVEDQLEDHVRIVSESLALSVEGIIQLTKGIDKGMELYIVDPEDKTRLFTIREEDA